MPDNDPQEGGTLALSRLTWVYPALASEGYEDKTSNLGKGRVAEVGVDSRESVLTDLPSARSWKKLTLS